MDPTLKFLDACTTCAACVPCLAMQPETFPLRRCSQRSRMFEGEEEEDELANELARDGFDMHLGSSPPPEHVTAEDMETIDLGPGWGTELNGLWRSAGGRSCLRAVPNSWEDLADDDAVERSSPPGK